MFASTKTSRIELFRYALTLPILIALSACGTDVALDLRAPPTKPPKDTTNSSAAMPHDLRRAFVASTQRNANAAYAVQATRDLFQMSNPAQKFVASISPARLSLVPDQDVWRFSLHTHALGCNGRMTQLANGLPEARANRVTVRRNDVEEWYLHGPLGVEQGFVVPIAPECAGTKRMSMTIEGDLHGTLEDADGDGRSDAVFFLDAQNNRKVAYTDLFVVDATGKTVPAWFSLSGNEVTIELDDGHATYPLLIDPLLWVQQAQLVAGDGAASDRFGVSVSISGDTALVGAYRDNIGANTDQGSAYVFVRNGVSWTEQAQLVANDGAAIDYFGNSVAISGDTAVVGAWADDVGATADQGSAYVFVRNGTTWAQQAQLIPSNGALSDAFGYSVAIDGNTAVVGSRFDDVGRT